MPETIRPLNSNEWNEIESKMAARAEICCPICMSGFTEGCEVLLSCSHVFHRHCIASFERFVRHPNEVNSVSGNKIKGTPICPLCRSPNYQKRITKKGSMSFRSACVIRIQRICRGFMARLRCRRLMRLYYNEVNC